MRRSSGLYNWKLKVRDDLCILFSWRNKAVGGTDTFTLEEVRCWEIRDHFYCRMRRWWLLHCPHLALALGLFRKGETRASGTCKVPEHNTLSPIPTSIDDSRPIFIIWSDIKLLLCMLWSRQLLCRLSEWKILLMFIKAETASFSLGAMLCWWTKPHLLCLLGDWAWGASVHPSLWEHHKLGMLCLSLERQSATKCLLILHLQRAASPACSWEKRLCAQHMLALVTPSSVSPRGALELLVQCLPPTGTGGRGGENRLPSPWLSLPNPQPGCAGLHRAPP